MWVPGALSNYLGIILTSNPDDLVAANYTSFLKSFKDRLHKLAHFELSWFGRLAAFKMLILPQLLYIFRTLPIPLPNVYFNSLQSTLNSFLWQGKKARCAFSKIIKSRTAGGLGHVHLQDYYFASVLNQLSHWVNPDSKVLWKDLEQLQVPKVNLRNFLMTVHLNKSLDKRFASPILASLRAWAHLCAANKWEGPTTPFNLPITAINNIIPDLNLALWKEKGIINLEDIIVDSHMMTFEALQQRYLLPLHKYVRNLHYMDRNEDERYFNERRDASTYLGLQMWIFLNKTELLYKTISIIQGPDFVPVMLTNMSDPVSWKRGKIPVSRCSDPCLPGSRKKFGSSIHKCCYECVPCPEGEISNISDSTNCMKCPDDEWPNEKKDRCVPKLVEFLSYTDDPIVGVFSAVSILCCLLTGLILRIFIHYQDTPIVKANNRDLSYLLLVSIMLSFLCVFLFLGHPVDVTCMLRVTSFGVIFSVAVSSLLAKSIMVCIAFKATKPGSPWRKWMGTKLPNCIICVFSLVQVIICVTWLSISPPFQDRDTHSYQGKIIIQCNEGSVIGFYSVLGYMGLLAAVSFIIAFLARTLPDSFNEAKYITFSMLVFCSVWIAMIPAYLSTRGKYMVAVEVFAIMASSSGLLGCIFFPKSYIILFRPDLNTKTYIH
ncbi:vomeronasal type-2 receptor 26-like [Rana temporaria]|uniref:vomeronasal type-2 receptor 26-like n=1 Tax=Rana temporaria TaxID=8407 RepID=UPI001AAC9F91|nr:vomeronasal type-2 receptor 26-like [Rana temporaria]